jgi:hypothetical protein
VDRELEGVRPVVRDVMKKHLYSRDILPLGIVGFEYLGSVAERPPLARPVNDKVAGLVTHVTIVHCILPARSPPVPAYRLKLDQLDLVLLAKVLEVRVESALIQSRGIGANGLQVLAIHASAKALKIDPHAIRIPDLFLQGAEAKIAQKVLDFQRVFSVLEQLYLFLQNFVFY